MAALLLLVLALLVAAAEIWRAVRIRHVERAYLRASPMRRAEMMEHQLFALLLCIRWPGPRCPRGACPEQLFVETDPQPPQAYADTKPQAEIPQDLIISVSLPKGGFLFCLFYAAML